MQAYMQNCISGMFRESSFSALEKSLKIRSEMPLNLSISNFSRTKLFTTRMPCRFSCTTAFSLS